MVKRLIRHLARLCRWLLWLALAGALAFQIRVYLDGGIKLPDFAKDYLTRRVAREGLGFSADEIWVDPRGRVLLIQPRLGLEGQDGPFATARAVSLRLRRRSLLTHAPLLRDAQLTGLALTLPAIISPTGAPQPVLEAGEFRLSQNPQTKEWSVDQASARLLSIPAAFTGSLPARTGAEQPSRPPAQIAREILREAAGAYRQVASLPLESLRVLRVNLAPDGFEFSAEIERLEVPAHPAIPPQLVGATLDEVRMRLDLPFNRPLRAPAAAELRILAKSFAAPPALAVRGDHLALRATPGPVVNADIALARLEKTDLQVPALPLIATLRFATADRMIDLDASTRFADAGWSLRLVGSGETRAGEATAAGKLTPALLEVLRQFLPEKARPILQLTDPVALDLRAHFAPGAQPDLVVARASSGRAVAGHVPFDRAGATLVYEPAAKRFRADELLLVQSDSIAKGGYEMHTDTLAFRFLLAGRLRPMAIGGWFTNWWSHFWDNFAFGPTPPNADVDIQGVWREPDLTTVFVQADSGPMRLRELELDRLHTRLRVAVDSFDIIGFHATQGPYVADGRFARTLDDQERWARMTFDVRSDFPTEALPRLFPDEAPELIAPFKLESAPRIHLAGEVLGPGSATPGHQNYDLALATSAPLRYEGFPLDHLSLRLERRDGDIHLRDLQAGFADGTAEGVAMLSGPEDKRWLAFDITLANADLDLAQSRWREFQATRPQTATPAAPAAAKPKKAAAESKDSKPLGGRVTLHLSATGPMNDPLAYSGRGEAKITGADLARIRLMGPFSSLLGELGLGFTTVKLTEADARLALDQNKLVFEELRLTGASALLEAKGVYTLSSGALDFTAKLRPFEQSGGILGSTASFVTAPLSAVLEVELGGTIEEPTWTFAYGPRKLFRKLTDKL